MPDSGPLPTERGFASDTPGFFAGRASLLAEIREAAVERDRSGAFPHDFVGLLKREGFTASRLPFAGNATGAVGGSGAGLTDLIGDVITLAAADSSLAHSLRSHFGFVESALLERESSTAFLEAAQRGETFAPASSERSALRPMEVDARLIRVPGGYQLSGTKNYTTGALGADWIYVSGRDETGTVRAAIIPASRAGVRIHDDFDGIGQRATGSGSVQLDGVQLSDAEISPPLAFDHPPVRYRATFGQLYLVAVLAGIGQAALEDAVLYVRSNARPAQHALQQRPADDPVIQTRLGNIAALVHAAKATALAAAASQEQVFVQLLAGDPNADQLLHDLSVAVAEAHVAVSAAVLDAANQVFALGSGSAVTRAEALDRHWRNARTVSNHSPLDYKCQVIGAALLNGTSPPTNGYF